MADMAVPAQPRLDDYEFQLLNELLEARYGLVFPDAKREILESRLRPRLQAHGMQRFMDYYLQLLFGTNGFSHEHIHLVQAITNNETYFFREAHQFEAFFGHALDEVVQRAAPSGVLRLQCAGCSTGEEAYTVNMYVKESALTLGGLPVQVDAVDLDPSCLQTARQAEYGPRSLRVATPDQVHRYFLRRGDERFAVRQSYRSGVSFSSGNLIEPGLYPVPAVYDAVFCRNVLIYFSEGSLHRAVDNFARGLRLGGLLFLGHSESIIGLSPRFEALRVGSCIAYRKVS